MHASHSLARRIINTAIRHAFAVSGFTALSLMSGSVYANALDHAEFEASISVPFRSAAANEARYFNLNLEFPGAESAQVAAWRVQLISPTGKVIQTWYGLNALPTKLTDKALVKKIYWAGRANQTSVPDGLYTVKMEATSVNSSASLLASNPETTVPNLFKQANNDMHVQSWQMQIGQLRAVNMPAPKALISAAAKRNTQNSLGRNVQRAAPSADGGYTVYYGNLHSQTNHSDGGGEIATCSHAVAPQKGAYGPQDAYNYAKNHGLDFLMTSEHNHLFDGNASSTNANADVAAAKARYQTGLQAASNFNASNPNFMALYGMEWGVISNGGHLNIFGSKELFAWESNGKNELIGDIQTTKGDYAGLYTLMKQKNLLGQFNHPEKNAQFIIGSKPLAYSADGDQVMALCEIANSSAFANVTDESDTALSSYESACNKILENGFHVAFSTNQDNHCANWGASAPNRTGVLIPNGTAYTNTSFMDALRARRVFATMDKNSQIMFTANSHIMGERFNNTGTLTLSASFTNSAGKKVAAINIIEGVPGSSGSTALLADTAQVTITPKDGAHFYYAKITQDDGKIIWSAPIWVNQSGTGGDPSDTQAPTATGAVTGSSGTIQLSAKALDNVAVTKVEFYVDNALRGASAAAPYTLALDSTQLTNGSHNLLVKAYDAAGNVGSSSVLAFTVSNVATDTTAPTVSVTESGSSGTIKFNANAVDNVGVTRVDYLLDSVVKGSSNVAPYAVSYDSTLLTNGNHTLQAKAYDAAGNVGTSSSLSFAVNNAATATEMIVNGGFESRTTGWKAASGVITSNADEAAHGGTYKAWLNGYGTVHTDTLYQVINLPATISSAQYSFWLKVVSDETVTTLKKDTLSVQVRDSAGKTLATLATFSNLDKGTSYKKFSFDLSSYKGKSVQLYFEGVENSTKLTSFLIDDVSLIVK